MVAQKVVKTSAKSCERGVTLRGIQWRGVTLRGIHWRGGDPTQIQWQGVTPCEPLAATEKGNLCSSSTLRVRFLFSSFLTATGARDEVFLKIVTV